MKRSKSSQRWLNEHFNDVYVQKAQKEGYRSRAVYKLKEIDGKENIIQPGMVVLDLGAAPGGWTQYAAEKMNHQGQLIAMDCLPMDALPGVCFIQGDFTEETTLHALQTHISEASVDLILSDMAPNMSGNKAVDMPKAMYLCELVIDLADSYLKPGGTLLMKIFHGEGFDELIKFVRKKFKKVSIRKPDASRSRSRETYLLAKNYTFRT